MGGGLNNDSYFLDVSVHWSRRCATSPIVAPIDRPGDDRLSRRLSSHVNVMAFVGRAADDRIVGAFSLAHNLDGFWFVERASVVCPHLRCRLSALVWR